MITLDTFNCKLREVGLVVVEDANTPGNFFLYDKESGRTFGPQMGITVEDNDRGNSWKYKVVTVKFRIPSEDIKVLKR